MEHGSPQNLKMSVSSVDAPAAGGSAEASAAGGSTDDSSAEKSAETSSWLDFLREAGRSLPSLTSPPLSQSSLDDPELRAILQQAQAAFEDDTVGPPTITPVGSTSGGVGTSRHHVGISITRNRISQKQISSGGVNLSRSLRTTSNALVSSTDNRILALCELLLLAPHSVTTSAASLLCDLFGDLDPDTKLSIVQGIGVLGAQATLYFLYKLWVRRGMLLGSQKRKKKISKFLLDPTVIRELVTFVDSGSCKVAKTTAVAERSVGEGPEFLPRDDDDHPLPWERADLNHGSSNGRVDEITKNASNVSSAALIEGKEAVSSAGVPVSSSADSATSDVKKTEQPATSQESDGESRPAAIPSGASCTADRTYDCTQLEILYKAHQGELRDRRTRLRLQLGKERDLLTESFRQARADVLAHWTALLQRLFPGSSWQSPRWMNASMLSSSLNLSFPPALARFSTRSREFWSSLQIPASHLGKTISSSSALALDRSMQLWTSSYPLRKKARKRWILFLKSVENAFDNVDRFWLKIEEDLERGSFRELHPSVQGIIRTSVYVAEGCRKTCRVLAKHGGYAGAQCWRFSAWIYGNLFLQYLANPALRYYGAAQSSNKGEEGSSSRSDDNSNSGGVSSSNVDSKMLNGNHSESPSKRSRSQSIDEGGKFARYPSEEAIDEIIFGNNSVFNIQDNNKGQTAYHDSENMLTSSSLERLESQANRGAGGMFAAAADHRAEGEHRNSRTNANGNANTSNFIGAPLTAAVPFQSSRSTTSGGPFGDLGLSTNLNNSLSKSASAFASPQVSPRGEEVLPGGNSTKAARRRTMHGTPLVRRNSKRSSNAAPVIRNLLHEEQEARRLLEEEVHSQAVRSRTSKTCSIAGSLEGSVVKKKKCQNGNDNENIVNPANQSSSTSSTSGLLASSEEIPLVARQALEEQLLAEAMRRQEAMMAPREEDIAEEDEEDVLEESDAEGDINPPKPYLGEGTHQAEVPEADDKGRENDDVFVDMVGSSNSDYVAVDDPSSGSVESSPEEEPEKAVASGKRTGAAVAAGTSRSFLGNLKTLAWLYLRLGNTYLMNCGNTLHYSAVFCAKSVGWVIARGWFQMRLQGSVLATYGVALQQRLFASSLRNGSEPRGPGDREMDTSTLGDAGSGNVQDPTDIIPITQLPFSTDFRFASGVVGRRVWRSSKAGCAAFLNKLFEATSVIHPAIARFWCTACHVSRWTSAQLLRLTAKISRGLILGAKFLNPLDGFLVDRFLNLALFTADAVMGKVSHAFSGAQRGLLRAHQSINAMRLNQRDADAASAEHQSQVPASCSPLKSAQMRVASSGSSVALCLSKGMQSCAKGASKMQSALKRAVADCPPILSKEKRNYLKNASCARCRDIILEPRTLQISNRSVFVCRECFEACWNKGLPRGEESSVKNGLDSFSLQNNQGFFGSKFNAEQGHEAASSETTTDRPGESSSSSASANSSASDLHKVTGSSPSKDAAQKNARRLSGTGATADGKKSPTDSPASSSDGGLGPSLKVLRNMRGSVKCLEAQIAGSDDDADVNDGRSDAQSGCVSPGRVWADDDDDDGGCSLVRNSVAEAFDTMRAAANDEEGNRDENLMTLDVQRLLTPQVWYLERLQHLEVECRGCGQWRGRFGDLVPHLNECRGAQMRLAMRCFDKVSGLEAKMELKRPVVPHAP